MKKLLIVEKFSTGRVDYKDLFKLNEVEEGVDMEIRSLVEDRGLKTVTKKDVVVQKEELKGYDAVVLVGAEPTKFLSSVNSVVEYNGALIDDNVIPMVNPAMLAFKPEMQYAIDHATKIVRRRLLGKTTEPYKVFGLCTEEEVLEYCKKILDDPSIKYVAMDCETTGFEPRDNVPIGISLSTNDKEGVYFHTDLISEEIESLIDEIINTRSVIFHNAKFDVRFLEYHFSWRFKNIHDTMLMHYVLDENSNHGLKGLCIKYTDLGAYDEELDNYRKEYCRKHKIKREDFTYDLIPFDIIYKYAAIDAMATMRLFNIFKKPFVGDNADSRNFSYVYKQILLPSLRFLIDIEDFGVPFSREYLERAREELSLDIQSSRKKFYEIPEVAVLEEYFEKEFNPNSVIHLRYLLFTLLKLPTPNKKTGTGKISTDKEVLESLKNAHPAVPAITEYKQKMKILNTYIVKVLEGLSNDDRIRTGFNLSRTTSGRLSSSGKLNVQQLPRDNKVVKKCIRPSDPNKVIVSMDLQTGEVYVAAVLSGDPELQKIFINGGDFHSAIAKDIYQLPCKLEEVKELYPKERQVGKTITFSILYGAGPDKVAETAGITRMEAEEAIKAYFKKYKVLKKWLDNKHEEIKQNGYTYTIFRRKRRVPNVFSTDRQVVAGEVRSATNCLVQSVCSDINLLGAVDTHNQVDRKKAKIFMLVHDSIVAEVDKDYVDTYVKILAESVQKDRGCTIPGRPISIDVEVGPSYGELDEYDFTRGYVPSISN